MLIYNTTALAPGGAMMAFLSRLRIREQIPELMDDPSIDPEEHRVALAGLARINHLTDSAGVLWPSILKLARKAGKSIRILDVATGSGDVPVGILRRARRAGVAIQVAGCDLSATAIAEATERTKEIRFFVHNVVQDPLPSGFDIVTCSLFLHHLSKDDALTLFTNMERAATSLILVNDLARSRFNYCAVWTACRLLTRSRVVRFDGPASVRSAFTPEEALEMARRAGLREAVVQRKFPARFLLSWERA